MKCRDARELINSYIDNGLDPSKDTFLMEHVKKCRECGEEYRFIIEYRKTVKLIRPFKAPDNFMAELQRKLEKEKPGFFRRSIDRWTSAWNNFTFPLEAAGVFAVALLVFFLYSPLFRGVKSVKPVFEDQSAVEILTENREEQIREMRKLLPPAKKKEGSGRLSVSSEAAGAGDDKKADAIPSIEENFLNGSKDSGSPAGKSAEEEPVYDTDYEKSETGAYRSVQERKDSHSREMSKKEAISTAKVKTPVITPEKIINENGGEITASRRINDHSEAYTVEISRSRLPVLAEKLKRSYSAEYRVTGRTGETLTVEFVIKK